MKLEPDGRRRLEAMKRALAAGLPLAGLLAAAACSKEPQEKATSQLQRNWVYRGEAEAPMEFDSAEEEFIPCNMGVLIEPSSLLPFDQLPDDEEELVIDTDMDACQDTEKVRLESPVITQGVFAPPSPSKPLPLEIYRSDDDVVVRVEDADSEEAEAEEEESQP